MSAIGSQRVLVDRQSISFQIDEKLARTTIPDFLGQRRNQENVITWENVSVSLSCDVATQPFVSIGRDYFSLLKETAIHLATACRPFPFPEFHLDTLVAGGRVGELA